MFIIEFSLAIVGILILLVFIITFGIPAVKGAQFAVTTPSKVIKIIAVIEKYKKGKITDLGSGDGRIVIAAARAGFEAHGYEINPFLVWLSRRKIKRAGLEKKAFIHRQDLWRVNLSGYDIITLFGVGHRMKKFETKLRTELKPGAIVISNYFQFPSWPSTALDDNIYLYRQ